MKSVTIYDTATGEVKKTLIVPLEHVVVLQDGEGVLDGQYDDDKFMVLDGNPIKRPMTLVSDEHSEPQPVTESDVRRLRGMMLSASDWTQVADAPVDRDAWAAYRQALRDVTLQDGFPLNIIWPNPPES
jgi:hypothetical protein